MITHKANILVLLPFLAGLIICSHASQFKKAVPFGSSSVEKRNLGGKLKDWYLSGMTHNYMCTDTGRLVPVDPETGHMLLKGLRKRANWFDDLIGHSHATEKGLCRNPTWVLPPGWTQPIPVTQFNAQYPWVTVDDRGQIHFKDDFKAWLDQRSAAGGALGSGQAQGGGAGAAGASDSGAVQDGGAGFVPSSGLNVAPDMRTPSGFGSSTFGNGVAAGAAAHV